MLVASPLEAIPGSDDASYYAHVLLIYKPMNLSERSLLHVVQELHKSASPHGGERENVRSSANRATLVVRKNTRTFSQSHIPGLHCDLHFETQSCFTSLAGEVRFVY